MMLTNTRTDPANQQLGRISVLFAAVLVTAWVSAMALTFSPIGFPGSQTVVRDVDSSNRLAVSAEVHASAGTPVTTAPRGVALNAVADLSAFTVQTPLSLDHSVLNNPDILPAVNPAPMAVAAYE